MSKLINDYSIVALKRGADRYDENAIYTHYYFVDGYKTLPTMRKRFDAIKARFSCLEYHKDYHDDLYLVARDYDRNIIKIYDVFKG